MVSKKRKRVIKKEDRSWDAQEHFLVPKHEKLPEKDKKVLLDRYNCEIKDLPKIFINDPAIQDLSVKAGDVIKIERASPTAGTAVYYRVVIEGV